MHWLMIILLVGLSGCATTPTYDPMKAANRQELLLNESSFKAVREGMTIDEVHHIMGTELVIGYKLQDPDYKPLTIANPYKSETIEQGNYLIEYYVQAIRQPEGVVSDNELIPFIFKDGKLTGRGWSVVNALRKPQA